MFGAAACNDSSEWDFVVVTLLGATICYLLYRILQCHNRRRR